MYMLALSRIWEQTVPNSSSKPAITQQDISFLLLLAFRSRQYTLLLSSSESCFLEHKQIDA